MTFEELRKANEAINLVDIKGKMYAPVSERVKAFRMAYPTGWIHTEILSNEGGVVVMRATVGVGDLTLGTGTAFEKETGSYINKTSYIENCETSAVGRALGFAGFGIDTDIASAEELANAELNNDSKEKINDPTRRAIIARCDTEGIPLATVLRCARIKDLADMTNEQHMRLMEKWDTIKAAVESRGGKS